MRGDKRKAPGQLLDTFRFSIVEVSGSGSQLNGFQNLLHKGANSVVVARTAQT